MACIGPIKYHIFDAGGSRSERKKWVHILDEVDVVLFFVALDGYGSHMPYDIRKVNLLTSLSILLFSIFDEGRRY